MAQRKKRPRRAKRVTRAPAGTLPGSLTFVDPHAKPGSGRLMTYDADRLEEVELPDPATLGPLDGRVAWVDVAGVGDTELVRGVGEAFDLHPLALEDVIHVHQRPKLEEYESGFYFVMRMPRFDSEGHVELEQLSLFFGTGYVVTFQEDVGDCLDPVRERLRRAGGRVRTAGADYLAYSLLDAVIDAYFPILEVFGERLETLEDRVLTTPDRSVVEDIHAIKRDLIAVRRAVWPLREAVNRLEREEHPLINRDTKIYLRDCYDHCVQLVELVETYREVATGLLDVYLSSVSNRMNEVMKVLTIIATIFIPLSFVASVYGMNFDTTRSPFNMPELGWRFGYPYVLGLMATMVIGLLVYFRVKRWI